MSGVSKVAWPMRRGLIIVALQIAGLFFLWRESTTVPNPTQDASPRHSRFARPRNGANTLAKLRQSRFGRGPISREGAMAKSAGYKLATYQGSDGPRAGLVIGDKVFDVAALTRKPAYASV